MLRHSLLGGVNSNLPTQCLNEAVTIWVKKKILAVADCSFIVHFRNFGRKMDTATAGIRVPEHRQHWFTAERFPFLCCVRVLCLMKSYISCQPSHSHRSSSPTPQDQIWCAEELQNPRHRLKDSHSSHPICSTHRFHLCVTSRLFRILPL